MHTDDAFLREMLDHIDDPVFKRQLRDHLDPEPPDDSEVELQLERLQREVWMLEEQLGREEAEYFARQNFLAEIARERANLGENYRVNWLKEGF